MPVRILTDADHARYQTWLQDNAHASLWQSLEWRTYQTALGRTVRIYALEENTRWKATALVVCDQTVGGFSVWDIPRGPLVCDHDADYAGALLSHIIAEAKKTRCIALYSSPVADFFSYISISKRREQPKATSIIDCTQSEEVMLAAMHPKGRYNIKIALQHGVKVARSDDVDAFYALVTRTANDDGFQSHGRTHYVTFLRSLPESFLLLATHESAPEPIAGLIGVVFGRQGIYYYGASDRRYKALMAPYVLQWAAIQHCKAQECTSYDLFGIAPEGSAHDPWAGITDFKKKFGGKYIAYAPERAVVLRPFAQSLLALKRRLLR